MADQTADTSKTPEKPWFIRWRETKPGHARKASRPLFPAAVSDGFVHRAAAALFPWLRSEYPGKQRLLAWLLGMANHKTATRYAWMKRLPAFRYRIIAERLRAKIAELEALAAEAEALAGAPCAKPGVDNRRARVKPPE